MSDVIRFPSLDESSSQTAPALTGTRELTDHIKMSDLYSAPQAATGDSSPNTRGGVTDFMQKPCPLPTAVAGWSNQELADLYRTQRILALAGITTNVDRGVTDEGDPWFVFMDSQGEVFVHFSRFDGRYLVTSQMQDAPVWGDNLQDLVTKFSEQVKPVTQAGDNSRNVVSLGGRSRNAVLIHPAAALAALVWSIYLMSDDLVAAVPMMSEDAGAPDEAQASAGIDINLQDVNADLEVLPDIAQKALQALSDPALGKQIADPYTNRDSSTLSAQIAGFSSSISMKAVGLGLSLVAISVGLPLMEVNAEEAEGESSFKQLSIEQLYTLITKAKEAALSAVNTAQSAEKRYDVLAEKPQDDATLTAEAETQNIETSAEFAEVVHSIANSYEAEVATLLALKKELAARLPQDEALPQDAKALTDEATQKQVVLSESSPSQENTLTDSSFLLRFDTAFENFTVANLDTLGSADLAELMTVAEGIDIADPLSPPVVSNTYESFDQDARMFLDFLFQTYSDIKVVSLATEIIFIHVEAFEMIGPEHQIYAKSWSFDDGGVISTIGLKSDLAQFDLIA